MDAFHKKIKYPSLAYFSMLSPFSSLHPQRPCSKPSLPSLATMEMLRPNRLSNLLSFYDHKDSATSCCNVRWETSHCKVQWDERCRMWCALGDFLLQSALGWETQEKEHHLNPNVTALNVVEDIRVKIIGVCPSLLIMTTFETFDDQQFCLKSNSILASIQFQHKWHVDHLSKNWCLMTSCLVFADEGPMCSFWIFYNFYSRTFDVI